jgi:uncharacterized protein (DUF1810 family)
MEDNYNLQRFLSAQGENIDSVILELNQGQKIGHWMWYIFPQVKGLGRSSTAEFYAIQSKDEAIEYLNHPVLGSRLLECTKAVNAHDNLTAWHIFGNPDYLKFRSCMTLFDSITNTENPFSEALDGFYNGEPDNRTLFILETI